MGHKFLVVELGNSQLVAKLEDAAFKLHWLKEEAKRRAPEKKDLTEQVVDLWLEEGWKFCSPVFQPAIVGEKTEELKPFITPNLMAEISSTAAYVGGLTKEVSRRLQDLTSQTYTKTFVKCVLANDQNIVQKRTSLVSQLHEWHPKGK